jgi:hypothetical protein
MKDLLSILFLVVLSCAWITHIIHCLLAAKYMLLIAGAFIFPVGIIHGVGLWFGVAW